MAEENITNQEAVSFQRKSIDALLSISITSDGFPTIEKIAKKAIKIIKEITGFRTVTFRIYDPSERSFRILAQSGMTDEMVKELYRVPEDFPVFAEIKENKEAAVTVPLKFIQDLGYKRTLFIPLVADDSIIGSIDLPTKTDYYPNDDEFRWFALVGRMIGSMVFQTQLTERLQSMAVIQERTRLVNELHDDFAQCVRSMEWGLAEIKLNLENDQLEQTAGIVDHLAEMVQNTSTYLREEMLGLREKVDSGEGIAPVLEGMLSRFERNWGIHTKLENEITIGSDHKMFLSPSINIQLIRIVQEALMNIRRHSNAKSAVIQLSENEEGIKLTIKDDGCGFRLEEIPQERLGLRVIRERSSSIGAVLQIESIVGTGTTLIIKIPSHVGSLL